MSSTRIAYSQSPDALPEAEISTLANVLRFVLDCHAKKRGCLLDKTGPDDAKLRSTKGVSDVEQQPR